MKFTGRTNTPGVPIGTSPFQ